jgi:hypothetical protein
MPQPYTEFRWFYPPRTKSRFPYNGNPVLKMWKGFADSIAQFKMNGINTMIVVFPNRTIELWSRHKEEGVPQMVKNYQLTPEHTAEILRISPPGSFSIWNAELLHHKTTMVKDTFYFFDVLVFGGQHLTGTEYRDRHAMIWDLLKGAVMPLNEPFINGGLFVAENIPVEKWDQAWKDAQPSPYVEGLVLKRMGATSRLQMGLSEINNGGFIARCRKPNKNYQH